MGVVGIVSCYNGSRSRDTKTTALCRSVASKKTFNL